MRSVRAERGREMSLSGFFLIIMGGKASAAVYSGLREVFEHFSALSRLV
jgi:hypothetical protein